MSLVLPGWFVLEGVASPGRVCRGGVCPLAPNEDFNDVDGFHGFLSRDAEDWRTRCLACELRSKAKGLTDGLGASNSSPSQFQPISIPAHLNSSPSQFQPISIPAHLRSQEL